MISANLIAWLNQSKVTVSHCVKSVRFRSFSCPYFLVFSSNTEKYGLEKTPDLDTFHVVSKMMRYFTSFLGYSL